jgi:hypothetical protein
MSWFPIVYISSDNSSEEEISYCSDSDELSSGWSGYFPPSAFTSNTAPASSVNKKSSKRNSAASASAPSHDIDSEKDDPTFNLSEELPKALTTALKTAIQNMNWPESSKPAEDLKPPPQVLGLACPRKQLSFDEKRNKPAKGKHAYEGKGKKPKE